MIQTYSLWTHDLISTLEGGCGMLPFQTPVRSEISVTIEACYIIMNFVE
jgi:hypothetical protein